MDMELGGGTDRCKAGGGGTDKCGTRKGAQTDVELGRGHRQTESLGKGTNRCDSVLQMLAVNPCTEMSLLPVVSITPKDLTV
jgi:hypothetical protein